METLRVRNSEYHLMSYFLKSRDNHVIKVKYTVINDEAAFF